MIDDDEEEAYVRTVMRLLIFRTFVLAAVLAAAGLPVAAEDLDSALAAQKKKAQHRVYSERAQLADHGLTMPRTESKEERMLDKKLREMDAKLDARPSSIVMPPQSRPVAVVPRPAEDKNWLTTTVMDNLKNTAITNKTDDSWLTRELARQKEAKKQDSLLRENEQVDKLVREKMELQQQQSSPVSDPLKKYQLTPPNIFGSVNKKVDAPSYMTPQSGTPDPLTAIRWRPKKNKPAAPALFSPEAARAASAPDTNPLHPIRPSSLGLNPGLNPGAPAHKSSSVFSYDRRDDPKPVPLTPIERIKRSSPIYRKNPFKDDPMPEFKTSIWQ